MRCSHCEHQNPANARYCNQCGQMLHARTVASYTPRHLRERILAHRGGMQGERKSVTVLFVDIVDSVAASEAIGSEAWHTVLDRCFGVFSAAVHAFDGTVNQYTGDGIMALFGAPIALERHAEMAAGAALRIQAEMAALAEECTQRYGHALRIRQGMNSGDVVVAAIGDDLRMDYTAKGQTTALAARLEARARPGTILLSGFSARLLGSQFALESLKTVSVKGIDEPVPCYRLLAARESAHAPGSVDFFSGREAELAQLSEAARLAAQGAGRVVWVRGESGVGKNHLLRAFGEQLLEEEPERRILRFQGSSQSRAEPAIAIRRMLRAVLGLHEEAEASEIADVLPEFLQQFGVQASAEVEAMQQWLLSPRQSQIPEDLLSAVQRVGTDLMRGGFAKEPLVFLLHDLAELDNAIGRPMMQLLFRALAHTRWLILASMPLDWTNPWEEGPHAVSIYLEPLSPEQVQSWLDQQLGTHASLEEFKKTLVRASGGYPLHVQAVLDSLQERGLLEQRRRGWVLKRPLEELPLPEQIVAIWSARIDALAPARKSLLQTMAVIGEQVSLPLLQRVSGLPQASLRAELSALEECRLLQREASKMWRFCQPAIRQVCYRGLLESQRQQWHGQVADAFDLEQAGPELLQVAAQHLRDAGRWEEALHVYLRLGDSCLLSDPALALQALEQAASVQQQGPALPRWVFYRQLWQLLHRPAELLEEQRDMCAEAQVLLAIQQLLQAERPAPMAESAAQDAPVWAALHTALCRLAQGEVALALESLPAMAACPAELQPWRDALGALLHALAGRPYTAWRQACDLRQRESNPVLRTLSAWLEQALGPVLTQAQVDPEQPRMVEALGVDIPLLRAGRVLLQAWHGQPLDMHLVDEEAFDALPLCAGLLDLVLIPQQEESDAQDGLRRAGQLLSDLPLLRVLLDLSQESLQPGRGLLGRRRFSRSQPRAEQLLRMLQAHSLRLWEPWALELCAAESLRRGAHAKADAFGARAVALRAEQGWRARD